MIQDSVGKMPASMSKLGARKRQKTKQSSSDTGPRIINPMVSRSYPPLSRCYGAFLHERIADDADEDAIGVCWMIGFPDDCRKQDDYLCWRNPFSQTFPSLLFLGSGNGEGEMRKLDHGC
jgi:hypothetical protein